MKERSEDNFFFLRFDALSFFFSNIDSFVFIPDKIGGFIIFLFFFLPGSFIDMSMSNLIGLKGVIEKFYVSID